MVQICQASDIIINYVFEFHQNLKMVSISKYENIGLSLH